MKMKGAKQKENGDDEKEERSDLFESKFVKQIIEAFNNVLEVVDQQEKELNEYIGADEDNKP
jgi:hypothetical protein